MMPFPRLILPVVLVGILSGCGLFSGSEDESLPTDPTFSEDATGEELGVSEDEDFFAFEEDADGGDPFAAPAEGEEDIFGGNDFWGEDDAFPETPAESTTSEDTTVQDDPFADSSIENDPFATDTSGTGYSEDSFASDDGTDSLATDPFEDSSTADLFAGGGFEESSPESKSFVPVRKMASAAFHQGGSKLNRIYIIRQNDTLSGVSQKIFGSDRVADIKKWNPYYNNNNPKVGDKVYYPSPIRPADESMLTYYDDQNIQPQTYVSQSGDNIRVVGKNLLGHDRSWMEIWATNPNVDSKGALTAGMSLRYWPDGAAVSTPIADTSAPTFDNDFSPPPASNDIAMDDPSIEEDDPFGSFPPPPSDSGSGLSGINAPDMEMDDPFGESGSMVPPPPPPRRVEPREELALPPPPPPRPLPSRPANAGGEEMNEDMLVYLVAGGLFLVLLIIFVFRRKRRDAVDMGHTQV